MGERERIREAAFELVLERGWREVTEESVAERAGLDPAVFERSYADVEECLLAVYNEAAAEMMARVADAVAAEESWLEQMRALGQAIFEFLLEDERRARFFVVEVVSGGDRVRLARERDLKEICAQIDRGRFELDDPDSVGPDTAQAVAGAVFLRVSRKVMAGDFQGQGAVEIVPELMHSLVLPYLGEEAAIAELHRPPPPPPPVPTRRG